VFGLNNLRVSLYLLYRSRGEDNNIACRKKRHGVCFINTLPYVRGGQTGCARKLNVCRGMAEGASAPERIA